MFDFAAQPAPTDLGALWDRIVRLVFSMSDVKVLKAVALVAGDNPVAHGCKTPPKSIFVQNVGTPSTAVTDVLTIGQKTATIHATASATVDLLVVL